MAPELIVHRQRIYPLHHQQVPQNLTFYGEMVALTEREEYNKTQT